MVPLVEIKDLSVNYYTERGTLFAVDKVSLSINKGEILGLAGESGSGKSTLGLSIMRLVEYPGKIIGGKIFFKEKNLLEVNEDEFRKEYLWKRIAMVFQGSMSGFTPVYTIGYQIEEAILAHEDTSREEARKRVEDLLVSVGLDKDIADRYPHELSGGQKQRAFIAMALALNPEFLIADEPTTALDVIVQAQIISLLDKIRREKGVTVMFVSHDISLLSLISDRIAIMYAGKIAEIGNTEEILRRPLHPYTQLLLSSVPKLKGGKIIGIPGNPPDMRNPPKGCRFHPRCPFVMERCKKEEPELIPIGKSDRKVACWLRGL